LSNSGKKTTIKRKIFLLIFLTVILLTLSAVVYTSNQYEKARQESLRLIEESSGKQEVEEIEFHGEESVEDYIHVLLLGVDKEDHGRGRTDTIIVAQYQPKNGKAKLVSLMRDTYVAIPGYRNNKINTAYFLGGPELLRKTIKENFDIDIHYYALIDFTGFERVVDIAAPNGIEVDIQRRMYYSQGRDHIDFQPGLQNLDGKQALNYVRFRSDFENDFGRVRRQQEVLTILKDELLSISGVSRLPSLLGAIEPYIQTNIENRKFLNYGRSFFLNPVNDMKTMTIPVTDGFVDAHYSHAGAVLELDIGKNKKALHEFLELDKLDEIDAISSNN
jgi:polyisoprenyl-teichoic acid--peptidoglycan teichoic acid transferase